MSDFIYLKKPLKLTYRIDIINEQCTALGFINISIKKASQISTLKMSFQNTVLPDGSININVIPSFGKIVNVGEFDKTKVVLFYPNESYQKLRDGRQPTDPSPTSQLISTLRDTFRSAQEKSSKNQSISNTFTNMSKDLD